MARKVTVDASAPPWAKRMETDVNIIIAELEAQIAMLKKRLATAGIA